MNRHPKGPLPKRPRSTERAPVPEAVNKAIEARLVELLRKHLGDTYEALPGVSRLSALQRVIHFAFVGSEYAAMSVLGWSRPRLWAAINGFKGAAGRPRTPDARRLERGKMLLIRLVVRGLLQSGEIE